MKEDDGHKLLSILFIHSFLFNRWLICNYRLFEDCFFQTATFDSVDEVLAPWFTFYLEVKTIVLENNSNVLFFIFGLQNCWHEELKIVLLSYKDPNFDN